MTTNITVRIGAKPQSRNGGEHSRDDNREPDGWAEERAAEERAVHIKPNRWRRSR